MKKKLISLLLSFVAVILVASPVLAATLATFNVTNTGAAYSNVPIIVSMSNSNLVAGNFILPSGLDVDIIQNTSIPHMLADDKTLFVASLPASSTTSIYYTTGNAPATSMPIIVGSGGYVTTPYNVNLEPGSSNWELDFPGFIDTTHGVDKYICNHSGEITVKDSTTTDGTITATITDGGGNHSVTLTGVSSGYYSTASLIENSGTLTFTIGTHTGNIVVLGSFDLSSSTEINLPSGFKPIPNSMCMDSTYLYVLASNSNNTNFVSVLKISRVTGSVVAQLDFSHYYDFTYADTDHSRLMVLDGNYLYLIEPNSTAGADSDTPIDKVATSGMTVSLQTATMGAVSLDSDGTYVYVALTNGGLYYLGYRCNVFKLQESDLSLSSFGHSSDFNAGSIVCGGTNVYVRGISEVATFAKSNLALLDLATASFSANTSLIYQSGYLYGLITSNVAQYSATVPVTYTTDWWNNSTGEFESICNDSDNLYIAAETRIWMVDIATMTTLSSGSLTNNSLYSNTLVDGTNLYVTDVDSTPVIRVYTKTAGAIPDTNSSWIWNENTIMPYMDSVQLSIGSLVLKYQPNTIILGTVLPDLDHTQNGIITWGTSLPANVTVTTTVPPGPSPITTSVPSPGAFVSNQKLSSLLPDVNPNAKITGGNEGSTFPLYPLFKSLLDQYNSLRPGSTPIPMAYFWRLVAAIIAFLFGTGVLIATRSMLFGAIAYGLGLLVPTLWLGGVFDWWVPVFYIIGAVVITMLSTKWTSSSIV